jgi:hypothetical protein
MGGRWYRCPNQHPYYVDLCGRPTVIQTCKDCGAQIGGLSHNLLEDNIDIGNTGTGSQLFFTTSIDSECSTMITLDYYKKTVIEDNSDRNYCLRTAAQESEDKFYSVRTLDPRGKIHRLFNKSM